MNYPFNMLARSQLSTCVYFPMSRRELPRLVGKHKLNCMTSMSRSVARVYEKKHTYASAFELCQGVCLCATFKSSPSSSSSSREWMCPARHHPTRRAFSRDPLVIVKEHTHPHTPARHLSLSFFANILLRRQSAKAVFTLFTRLNNIIKITISRVL